MYSIFICDDEPVFLNRIGKVVEDFFMDKADCTIFLQKKLGRCLGDQLCRQRQI